MSTKANGADYNKFLLSKFQLVADIGVDIHPNDINPMLFPFQRDVVVWAARKGRAALFLDTGLGKTFCQLEWARLIGVNTLIIAPLSVCHQTISEAAKLGLTVRYATNQDDIADIGIWITNYERIDLFDFAIFGAVVLDESSILKNVSGSTRRRLIKAVRDVPYRLACTATPSPNDDTELGNHAEFLGICSHAEMLATFFINANKEHLYHFANGTFRKKGSNKGGTEWRLKHHAEQAFFRWLSSWAICMQHPSDLGYEDDGFILPELNVQTHTILTNYVPDDQLFFTHLRGVQERNAVRAKYIDDRIRRAAEIIEGDPDGQWLLWAALDAESEAARISLGAMEVKGADSPENKAERFDGFQNGIIKRLVTKPRIGGMGMNFQNAHNMIFLGINDSWEMWYQCIRREWRYGQTDSVNVHIIITDIEEEILRNIERKDRLAQRLRRELILHTQENAKKELAMQKVELNQYKSETISEGNFTAMLGDAIERIAEVETGSVDLSVYSPPFMDLFTYTATERDLGNSHDAEEFFAHYGYLTRELLRVTKPGRLTCVHCSDIPAMLGRDGYIGIKDFPGELIRHYEGEGWQFVGRAFVQKNPQAQAIRTKSKALLFVQLRRDSSDSRPALVDQILLFKAPGKNARPITPVENGELDNETWIEWANGIWLGINESDVLRVARARGADDEKHVCPLQLGTIERCIKLYSNPGEVVLTPFGGIGSEAYQALRFGRKAIMIELKEEYFRVAINNLRSIAKRGEHDLFTMSGVEI